MLFKKEEVTAYYSTVNKCKTQAAIKAHWSFSRQLDVISGTEVQGK